MEIRIENEGRLAEEGEEGEIVLVGDSVAAGDVGTELYATSFGMRNGKRSYCTGDLGWMENGVLYCKGRLDSQVKIHGYRVEVLDVEKNLSALPSVAEVVVVSREDRNGRTVRLVGFVRLGDGQNQTKRQLQALLAQRLPAYMCPEIRFIQAFPLNENGKYDRKRLKEIADGKGDFAADPRNWE